MLTEVGEDKEGQERRRERRGEGKGKRGRRAERMQREQKGEKLNTPIPIFCRSSYPAPLSYKNVKME
jgi:hypothetical protein